MDILSLFSCFSNLVAAWTRRQLVVISQAVLAMTGRITMLGISRWTSKGGSYRTIQRFFGTVVPWTELFVKFFETHLFDPEREYILAGDETVVSKSGSETFGIDRLFSGLRGKVIKGLGFFVFSLVDTFQRKSYPLAVKQMVRSEAEKEARKARKKKVGKKSKKRSKAKRGRKKGSRNQDKKEFKPSLELLRINALLVMLLKLIRKFIKVRYVALDGHFGHNQAMLMARSNDLHLISKMRYDAALYEKYEGTYSGRGKRKRYGEKLEYDKLPKKYIKKSNRENDVITNYYQGLFLHKEFGEQLNVVVIVKFNLKSGKVGRVILFSSDVELGWEPLVDYYSLRFQIEFNFREAKQHFGLEDFMLTSKTGVENAANLSFMMVNVCEQLKKQSGGKCVSTNDLKTHHRGVKYAVLTLKKVMKKAKPILINQIIEEISRLGSIHQPNPATSSA
ncbi:MAG: transposase [Acidobacteriota bacterium]|nr:transposase [Acidobacteriota bacterium]